MLSYRHAFHAGNHADLLKHVALVALLQSLAKKETPFCYIDTHAGKGIYDLHDAMAEKNAEYRSGIEKLWLRKTESALLHQYCELVRRINSHDILRRYPGSPLIAQRLCREQDSLVLMELHNQEIQLLKQNLPRDKRVHVHHRDGFEGIVALSPPTPRRGMVLIDPAYEVKGDYQTVINCCRGIQRKWQTAVVAIWLPLLARARDHSEWMKQQFAKTEFPSALWLELKVNEQAEEMGMHGSALVILNCPWQVDELLAPALKELGSVLAPELPQATAMEWLKAPR